MQPRHPSVSVDLSWTMPPSAWTSSENVTFQSERSFLHRSVNSTPLFDSLLNDSFIMSNIKCNIRVGCVLQLLVYRPARLHYKYVNSRDSTKRCHWLQHFCLVNIFQHVCMQELQRVACNNCTWNQGIALSSSLMIIDRRPLTPSHTRMCRPVQYYLGRSPAACKSCLDKMPPFPCLPYFFEFRTTFYEFHHY